jgi:hypothetical protein
MNELSFWDKLYIFVTRRFPHTHIYIYKYINHFILISLSFYIDIRMKKIRRRRIKRFRNEAQFDLYISNSQKENIWPYLNISMYHICFKD